jgi:hypothetical protein
MNHPTHDHPDFALELRELGLMAAVSPEFAEKLVRTLLEKSGAADSKEPPAAAQPESIAA